MRQDLPGIGQCVKSSSDGVTTYMRRGGIDSESIALIGKRRLVTTTIINGGSNRYDLE